MLNFIQERQEMQPSNYQMEKQEKTTAVIGLIVIIAVCLMLIAVAVTYIYNNGGFGRAASESPDTAVFSYLNGLKNYAVFTDGNRLFIEDEPQSEDGKKLFGLMQGNLSIEFASSETEKRQAVVSVNLTCPDIRNLTTALHETMDAYLCEKAAGAHLKSDIYNDDGTYREDVIEEAYSYSLDKLKSIEDSMTVNTTIYLSYAKGQWNIDNPGSIGNTLDEIAAQIKTTATSNLTVWPVTYVIEENALKGPRPNPDGWGETEDPQEVVAMLQTDMAKRLIGDQEMLFSPDIQFIPGKKIRYYLDETILMIEWQETEAMTVGTFCEVIIADGSQLRRKIAGDNFGDMNFQTTSDFAVETNAVLAVGGDFYNHARNCGICVYQRQIYRFDPTTCDDCYITTNGDMLFSYRGQFSDVSEAQKFVEDNDVLFSVCFGPVLIDNGVDVTPSAYIWGEINDTYARSALGMLGEHHYLTMNLNCELPGHWYLATLRDAAKAMIKRGCINAYTLDGGQTATTAINGQLINPVQFGWQKQISDIIYFCTAVPEQ